MKRLYDTHQNGTKELKGYDYNGIIIDVDYAFSTRSYLGQWIRSGYRVEKLKEIGKPSWFQTLKEAKEYIDKYL